MSSIKSKFNKWIKSPKVKIEETPRKGEAILEVFHTEEKISKTGLYVAGADLDTEGKLEGTPTKTIVQSYPYAFILKSSIEEYNEGDIVYLDDKLLDCQRNKEYDLWKARQENTRPKMQELPPPKFVGGLYALERYKFKKDKLNTEVENIDDFLFQLPQPMVRGIYQKGS